MIADGFYKSLPMEDYLKEPALSKSGLSDLWLSPAHYKARKLEPKKFAAADLGSAVHALVLEPDQADKMIVTPPTILLGKNGAMSTNACKDWIAAQDPGVIVLNAADYDAAQCMRDAVIAHPRAAELLQGGNPEVSMVWTDGKGIRRKCRPDYMGAAYVDLKTAKTAKPEWFGKQAYDLHYHWSAYWTIEIGRNLGSSIDQYFFIAVEKESPWAVCVFDTPQELIEMAEAEIAPIYATYRACLEYDTWQSYSDQIETLKFPAWAYKKKEKN